MKTIAQQLKIKTFPFQIKVDGERVYYENSNGDWYKSEYQDGKRIYVEASDGYWRKREYQDDNCVYYEDSYGFWRKSKYQDGKEVYYENSHGDIRDNRPKSKAHAKVAEARKLLEEAEKELRETT